MAAGYEDEMGHRTFFKTDDALPNGRLISLEGILNLAILDVILLIFRFLLRFCNILLHRVRH
jgi:hypothetical protein